MKYQNKDALDFYRKMCQIRMSEEKLIEVYSLGKIPGHIHPGIGEEAAVVGVLATGGEQDLYKLTHRPASAYRVLGMPYKTIFSEIFGKSTGNSGGRAGIMHVSDLSRGCIGFSGILGCDAPVAVGAAMKLKRDGESGIVYCFYGDGTSNRGPVHEAMNLAGVWKLPVLFVCTNNQFAISLHVSRGSSVPNPGSNRAIAYGMPSAVVDGNDVFAVYEAAKKMADYVRDGNGPAVIETVCYRRGGHFLGDQAEYRSAKTAREEAKKDCILRLEKELLENQLFAKEDLELERHEISLELEETVKYAEESAVLPPDQLLDTLYA